MAFLQSQPPREPFLHAPASVLWLIGVLVAVHLAVTLAPASVADPIVSQLVFIPARFTDGASFFALTVPFVGHMLLHGGWLHLTVNCLWLLVCGPVVVRRFGTFSFLLFLVACGAAGAAAYLVLNWGSAAPMIGASGGISGLMAAAIRLVRWPNTSVPGPLMPIWSRSVLIFTGAWVVTNALFGILGFGTGEGAQIAWQAHLGGYLCGLFLIDLVDRLRPRKIFTV